MYVLVIWRKESSEDYSNAHVEIAHFPTRHIIRIWKALSLQPHAPQALMMHLFGKCLISTWAWVLSFIPLSARNIKAVMWKSCISAHPFSVWIVSFVMGYTEVIGSVDGEHLLLDWWGNKFRLRHIYFQTYPQTENKMHQYIQPSSTGHPLGGDQGFAVYSAFRLFWHIVRPWEMFHL